MDELEIYSHVNIRRYLQQQMSPEEMRGFEKALMNDPFLADAIEGFSASNAGVSSRHLAAIEQEVAGNKEKAKVVALTRTKTAWWKVAAIVLVIITGAALSYSLLNKSQSSARGNQTLATKMKESSTAGDSVGPVEKPIAKIDMQPPPGVQMNQQTNPPFIKKSLSRNLPQNRSNASSASSGDQASDMAKIDANEESASIMSMQSTELAGNQEKLERQRMSSSMRAMQQEFKGKIVDQSGEPVAFASVHVDNSNIGTIANAKGDFTLKASDSVVQVTVKSAGFAVANVVVKSDTDNKIILNEEKASLSDVVVATIQSKKEKRSSINSAANNTAEPEGGWKYFNEYVQKQMDSLKTGNEAFNYDHDVVLEFLINEQGRPANIKAQEPVDKKTAEKAMEILLKGPKWQSLAKEKKAKVIISF